MFNVLVLPGPRYDVRGHQYIIPRAYQAEHLINNMNFDLPPELTAYIESIDSFIKSDILPLQYSNDNNRFFDHRREYTRTDWENGGIPSKQWEDLLSIHPCHPIN